MKGFITLLIAFSIFTSMYAQMENVIVEKYYISDTNDAKYIQYIYDANDNITDSIVLEEGSTSYRVFVQMASGCKIMKVYGDANHTLMFATTSSFFNHADFGSSFGKDIKTSNLRKDLVALDTWLTLGQASSTKMGIMKNEDTDGSVVGGANNNVGLLANNNPSAGVPITDSDGLFASSALPDKWAVGGFTDPVSNEDSTVFGFLKHGNQFTSNSAFFQNSGAMGATQGSNKVLIAQLTTNGEISFNLNLQVLLSDGITIQTYVANKAANDLESIIMSRFLSYPLVNECGCRDSSYLEYDPKFNCSLPEACKTKIVFGCTDPMSCNYNPQANYSIPSLCCYPGKCGDRDISVICPDLGLSPSAKTLLYPNPVTNQLTLEVTSSNNCEIRFEIYNSFGTLMIAKNLGFVEGLISSQMDVSGFKNGIYMVRVFSKDKPESILFIKN